MKHILSAVLITSLLGACASVTTPNTYTFDTSSLKGKGLTEDCPIVINKTPVTVKSEQKYWQVFQDCITKYEPLEKTTKFSWTTDSNLPNGSKLVGYIFFKERLDVKFNDKMVAWSHTSLKHGGNYGVVLHPKELEEGVTMVAVYRGGLN
ncbi:TPA: hypothetical protein KDZ08_004971 [Vibrio parahaemolyticus]|uniref:hypothetical protein n=1 Tax=Vibrio TaxID=662 RepID=UPI001B813B07|nr:MULTISPECIES: hypothetical protein [Vibrio]BDP38575.1 hypothetical protein VA208B3_49460 [Vibrio alginolyticus]MCR9817915.1 hypothetical protein [Vibrio parahaemolyticus]BDP33536.1 hypothetical protein VV208B2_46160 [Vibrio vulnificus]HBC3540101.1 hypothetical protein [Vibrio parahaemolyticus]HBC3593061.1 hypothetical protein [Vibrio parahaemolyticus]